MRQNIMDKTIGSKRTSYNSALDLFQGNLRDKEEKTQQKRGSLSSTVSLKPNGIRIGRSSDLELELEQQQQ
jgi:hypothetical protein